jgi:predicted P-loop ATPase
MSWDNPSWKAAGEKYHADRRAAPKAKVVNIEADRKKRKPNNGRYERLNARMQLGFPDMTDAGKLQKTCGNVRHAFGLMDIKCEYDAFHDKLSIGGQAIGEYTGDLSDHACLVLRRMIEEQYDFDPGKDKMFDAAVQLCLENRFDPICSYLEGLRWDGLGRIDRWLTTYLGAANTPLNRAIGKIALVAQVRRARQPGCKFDQIIVMESPEGYMKSTALSVLAGSPENFSDQTILGASDKEQQELLRGVWIYEIADLSNIRRAEVEHVKAFASRTHDRARPAYGRALVTQPRKCVVWATTNNSEYLKSQTGNRRFWPFTVGMINIEALKRDRDQLLAEAVALDNINVPIVLARDLWGAAAEEQEQRREGDPWEDVLRDVKGELGGDEFRVLSHDLLEIQIGIPKARQTNQDSKRVVDCMRILGWQGPKVMRVGEKRGRGYWRNHRGNQ